MSREVHKRTMSWKAPHEGDPDALMARRELFGSELQSARYRTGALREVVGESRLQKSGFVLEVVEQLEPSLEELPVAGEELRRQNRQIDELLTTRSEPDADTMNLPLAPDSKVEPNVSDTEAHDLQARSERLEGLWVAVVDDDPDARELMRVVMEAAGARVTTCGSCEDALALFSDKATAALTPRRPDVIVADIAMPGRDGFDLIRALR